VKWLRRLVLGVAVAYPIALLVTTATLRFVGEAWWVSMVGLYLPRIGFALPLPVIVVALRFFRMRWLLRLQAVSAVVLVFPLMGFVVPLPMFANRDQPTMRVLSYNVNSGHDGVEAVLGEIAHYSPDVVLLQETGGHRGYESIGGPLKARYPTVEAAGEFIMATRYPPSPNRADSIAGDNFQREVLETPLGRLAIYNVHTVSPRHPLFALRGRSGIKHEMALGRGSPLESNADLRSSQVQTFSEAAAREADPVILAGDTNLPGLSPLFHRFLSSYEDGFSKASWGFGYTFPTHKGGPWMRIDRILAKAPLRFVRFEVGGAFSASDHLCVVGDLQRR
jgi:endonuclease/exonuclease/phosphatase (EEP) superfamily protein YafD